MTCRRIGIAVVVAICLTYLVVHATYWTETNSSIRFALPIATGDRIKIEATGPYTRYTEGFRAHQLHSVPGDALFRDYIVATRLDSRGVYTSNVVEVKAGTQIWEPAGGNSADMVLIGDEGTQLTVTVITPVNGVTTTVLSLLVILGILFWKNPPHG